jgi:hypothetical protein
MPLQIDQSVQLSWKNATRPFSIAVLALVSLLCAPLVARAGTISLAWDASTSTVSGYRIYYGTNPNSLTTIVDVGNQTSYAVSGLTNGVTYHFVVHAYTAQGVLSGPSNPVSGVPFVAPFTDPQLSSALTPIRVIHINEMRARINSLRTANGLAPVSWEDPVLTSGVTPVKAVHITQMRNALNQVYSARQLSPPSYSDPNLTAAATPVKGAHISDLRNAITAVE